VVIAAQSSDLQKLPTDTVEPEVRFQKIAIDGTPAI
jgi:hypothetical protein